MGVSRPESLNFLAETLIGCNRSLTKPRLQRMLDIGCGMGQHGLVMRAHGYVWQHYHDNPQDAWDGLVVDAIDANEKTILPYHQHIYDNIFLGNVINLCDDLPEYDLIYWGDCMEHLWQEDATRVLKSVWSKTKDLLFIAVPMSDGVSGVKESRYGGEWGGHLSAWNPGKVAAVLCGTDDKPALVQYAEGYMQYMIWIWRGCGCTFNETPLKFETLDI